jgi:hypothetical protein
VSTPNCALSAATERWSSWPPALAIMVWTGSPGIMCGRKKLTETAT